MTPCVPVGGTREGGINGGQNGTGDPVVVDLLGPGDMFGHLWLLAGLPPRLLVRAHEESLLLRVPDPRAYRERPDLLRFTGPDVVVTDRRLDQVMRPVVWAAADEPVRVVADRIGAEGQSCAAHHAR